MKQRRVQRESERVLALSFELQSLAFMHVGIHEAERLDALAAAADVARVIANCLRALEDADPVKGGA